MRFTTPNRELLNSRQVKEIKKHLKEQFGFSRELPQAWFRVKDDRLYIVSRDLEKIDLQGLRVEVIGMYFGEWKGNDIRLSIEAAQLIGPHATKNVIELSEEEMYAWLRGEDLKKAMKEKNFVLLKHDSDFLGCGLAKEGAILNFVPKSRRVAQPH